MPRQKNLQHHIVKFSTKPPGHDVARQRENQRRHRARVKEKMVDLEATLSNTQCELETALRQIENLNAEVQRLQSLVTTPQACNCNNALSADTSAPPWGPLLDHEPEQLRSVSTIATPTDHSSIEDPDNDCPLLPPPLAGESTITCRDAYAIIKGRNAPSDIDTETVNEWLKSGFRRAIIPGSGCRVETHVLFAFIDHLTST
ncbi:hypothetical protein QBC43DRAFT_320758 [Cladorrhinum sp. PSN259]|nr:hypothetical protein QBC43DRAFT_320758 [Cladorrhinum sp. PSN259]